MKPAFLANDCRVLAFLFVTVNRKGLRIINRRFTQINADRGTVGSMQRAVGSNTFRSSEQRAQRMGFLFVGRVDKQKHVSIGDNSRIFLEKLLEHSESVRLNQRWLR